MPHLLRTNRTFDDISDAIHAGKRKHSDYSLSLKRKGFYGIAPMLYSPTAIRVADIPPNSDCIADRKPPRLGKWTFSPLAT